MCKIYVSTVASQDKSYYTFSLEDLNVTEKEWEEMSDKQKEDCLQQALNDLPEQPYWCVDKFNTK